MKLKSLLVLMVLAVCNASVFAQDMQPLPNEASQQVIQVKINLNEATADELTELKSIGLKKAQLIVQYRNEHGDFKSVDELVNVKGIGNGILEKNRSRLVLAQQ